MLVVGLQQTLYQVLETDSEVEVCIVIEAGVLGMDVSPALRGFTQSGTATCKGPDHAVVDGS